MLIDTHCHIHDLDTFKFALSRQPVSQKFLKKNPDFPHEITDFDPDKILARAVKNGVEQVICVGTSHQDSLRARDFAAKHPGTVFWSYGIHPDEAESDEASDTLFSSEFANETPVAIGEVGLDYRAGAPRPGVTARAAQIKLFEVMLDLAIKHNLPLIFHVRDAFDDFFAILNNFQDVTGVVHSFSDTPANLKKSLDRGFYIGVNGLATFADIPLPPTDRLLLETDAPFLTPKPFRGTINEAARIKDICAYISRVKGVSEQEMAQITTENARKLFRLQHPIV
ncbi:TatD family hydrolase [Candidatus Saccharibacteria bacterium]|nr:TatD family hydrolase [Candidatus Saccharibacteria bacterium]